MKKSTKVIAAAAIAVGGIAGLAQATPIVGLFFATILATGASNEDLLARAHVALPPASTTPKRGHDHDDDNAFRVKFATDGPSTFIVQDVSYLPSGHTGWHSHPGILLSSVTEGAIEWYDSNCQVHNYSVGQSFTETDQLHYLRNVGSVNARIMITYVLALGQPRRIDQPAPACAAALGLF